MLQKAEEKGTTQVRWHQGDIDLWKGAEENKAGAGAICPGKKGGDGPPHTALERLYQRMPALRRAAGVKSFMLNFWSNWVAFFDSLVIPSAM